MPGQQTIGGRIGRLRKQKKLTQEYLAQQLGVSRQAVSKWETDQTLPDTANLMGLARLLGCTVGWLLTGEEPMPEAMPADSPASCRPTLAKRLHRLGHGLGFAGLALYLVGFLSGMLSEQVILWVNPAVGVGMPLLYYGKSRDAVLLLAAVIALVVLGLVLHLVAGFVRDEEKI